MNGKKAASPRQQYFQMRNGAGSWLRNAQRLKQAGGLLFSAYCLDFQRMPSDGPPEGLENLEMNIPATLLFGLSLESLIKAVRRLKGSPALNSHDLHKLLQGIQIRLTQREEDLVSRLKDFVVWAGRYPVPLEEANIFVQQLGCLSSEIPPFPMDAEEKDLFDSLFQKLERLLGPPLMREGSVLKPAKA